MAKDINNWTRNDFVTFILIHASFADKLIQEDEKKVITKFSSIERFYQLLEFYRNNNLDENKSIILDLKKKFIVSERDKDELLKEIHKLLKADKQFSEIEKQMADKIEEML